MKVMLPHARSGRPRSGRPPLRSSTLLVSSRTPAYVLMTFCVSYDLPGAPTGLHGYNKGSL